MADGEDGAPAYRRVLLKISGEALQGTAGYGIEPAVVTTIVQEIQKVVDAGIELAIVIGGGNIFRGLRAAEAGMDRATADYMGMLATIMNALALQEGLERAGIPTRVQSAIEMHQVVEPFIRRRALRHLEKGRVVLFAGGHGSPHFTTDTTAALRAIEMRADVIFKATQVDGVYDGDPNVDRGAARFTQLSYMDVLNRGLTVMDSTAITLCMENHMPVLVFDLHKEGNVLRAARGEPIGTMIGDVVEEMAEQREGRQA